jgi:hypothetical protein
MERRHAITETSGDRVGGCSKKGAEGWITPGARDGKVALLEDRSHAVTREPAADGVEQSDPGGGPQTTHST